MKDENDTKTADLLVDGEAITVSRQAPASFLRDVGRPRVHKSAAARQKAYRARQKMAGKRVVSRTVVDRRGGDTIKSDVILIPVFYRTRYDHGERAGFGVGLKPAGASAPLQATHTPHPDTANPE